MTTFIVKDGEGTVLLRMKAPSINKPPTSISKEEADDPLGLASYAEALMKKNCSVRAIASRMGYDSYVENVSGSDFETTLAEARARNQARKGREDEGGTEIAGPPHSELHPALQEVVTYLGGSNVDVVHPRCVLFDDANSFIDAEIKEGSETIRIRANLFDNDPEVATDLDVIDWIGKQAEVVGGVLQPWSDEDDDGTIFFPRIVFECPIGEFTTVSGIWRNHPGEIARFSEAWRDRSTAIAPDIELKKTRSYRFPPSRKPFVNPQNAWLLIGDAESYMDPGEAAKSRLEGEAGIYNTLWTAPKNIEIGDLAVFYFVGPIKAAHFVARAASRAFWRGDIRVTGSNQISDKQWWAYFTPPVEIEAIPYANLRDAQNGHLILKGRSGHLLLRETIDVLPFTAADLNRQEAVDRITQIPVGRADLPAPKDTAFKQWSDIPTGALRLEADVSNHIVEPMLRWAMDADAEMTQVLAGGGWEREHKVSKGFVDFVLHTPVKMRSIEHRSLRVLSGTDQIPLLAIEVKLATRRPKTGKWSDSPDFMQLRRYIDELDAPGLLIDAHSILFVTPGAETPCLELQRADVSEDVLMDSLRYFPLGQQPIEDNGTVRWSALTRFPEEREGPRRVRRRASISHTLHDDAT